MISRVRSDVMVNVFRCDRRAFNSIILLEQKQTILPTIANFKNNFCSGTIHKHTNTRIPMSKTEGKQVNESEYEKSSGEVPIFC